VATAFIRADDLASGDPAPDFGLHFGASNSASIHGRNGDTQIGR
jgi:hypothetical protein